MKKFVAFAATAVVVAGCDTYASDAEVEAAAPYSVDDFQRDYPGLGQAEFNRIDADLDGNLSRTEIEAARASGEI